MNKLLQNLNLLFAFLDRCGLKVKEEMTEMDDNLLLPMFWLFTSLITLILKFATRTLQ